MELAERLDGEVIGADSRQVYRHLQIGTAKPGPELRERIRHHCIDLVEPSERYSLAEYLRAARDALAEIRQRGRRPIVAGGTGQYAWALLEGWRIPPVAPDPELRATLAERVEAEGREALHAELRRVDPAAAGAIPAMNVRRVIRALEVYEHTGRPISAWQQDRDPAEFIAVAPRIEVDELDRRIEARVEAMFGAGLLHEVRALLDKGVPADAPGFDSIGYREALAALHDEMTEEEAVAAAQLATRQFARRQRAWFREDDDRIHWAEAVDQAVRHLLEA